MHNDAKLYKIQFFGLSYGIGDFVPCTTDVKEPFCILEGKGYLERSALHVLAFLVFRHGINTSQDDITAILFYGFENADTKYKKAKTVIRHVFPNILDRTHSDSRKITLHPTMIDVDIDVLAFKKCCEPDANESIDEKTIRLRSAVGRYQEPIAPGLFDKVPPWLQDERVKLQGKCCKVFEELLAIYREHPELGDIQDLYAEAKSKFKPSVPQSLVLAFDRALSADVTIRLHATPSNPPDVVATTPHDEMDGLSVRRFPAPDGDIECREADIAKLSVMLQANTAATRWITLIGQGGIGKTGLAVNLANELQSHYDYGIHFIDLSGTEASIIEEAVCSAFAVADVHQLLAHLRDR